MPRDAALGEKDVLTMDVNSQHYPAHNASQSQRLPVEVYNVWTFRSVTGHIHTACRPTGRDQWNINQNSERRMDPWHYAIVIMISNYDLKIWIMNWLCNSWNTLTGAWRRSVQWRKDRADHKGSKPGVYTWGFRAGIGNARPRGPALASSHWLDTPEQGNQT